MHELSDEFEFQPDLTTDCGVSCHRAPEENPHRLMMGKNDVFFWAVYDRIFRILAGKSWMSSNLVKIPRLTTELASL